jgi:hypothetical protein
MARAATKLRITPSAWKPSARQAGDAYRVGTASVALHRTSPNSFSVHCVSCESPDCEHANALRRAVLIGTSRSEATQ